MLKPEISVVLLVAAALAGCSSRDLYGAGQAWQRSECNRMLEPQRSECMEQSKDDYDTYRKKREGTY